MKHTDAYEEMFHPPKPPTRPNVWCYKCKSDSGWTNSDLMKIRGNYSLKCQNCKKVCIQMKSNVPAPDVK
jgi:hypothetical protein